MVREGKYGSGPWCRRLDDTPPAVTPAIGSVRPTEPHRRTLALGVVLFALAVIPMLGSLANGFAWDDVFILESNPRVQSGEVLESTRHPYWPDAFTFSGSGLYRPTTSAAFTFQWEQFGGRAFGFHGLGILLHALVTLCVFAWIRGFVLEGAAFAGAALFAVHPVHVEAVANVVGQAELWAALFTMVGLFCWRAWLSSERPLQRTVLTLAVAGAYLIALGAKEIAVTMPILAWVASMTRKEKWVRSGPLLAVCGGVLLFYLAVRLDVVGTLRGEVPAPELIGLTARDRIFTGLSIWVDYLRLLVVPLDLSADYGPAVRFPAQGFDPIVLVGTTILVGAIGIAMWGRRSFPPVSLGMAWIVLALLPVSNLVVPAGVLLAERTLYLPSVGIALVVGGLFQRTTHKPRRRGWMLALTLVVVLFAARSALRVPVWESSETVLESLEQGHPRSHLVLRRQAVDAMQRGATSEARARFDEALSLVPNHFSLLGEAAQFEALVGESAKAESLASRAVDIYPTSPHGYVVQARVRTILGDAAGARAAVLAGIRNAEPLTPLWNELERLRQPSG